MIEKEDMKIVMWVVVFGGFFMSKATPFSFKEVDALEKFDVTVPLFLKASDGVELAYYKFVDTSSKKIVVLYAGAGLYGNKTYQWVGKTLQEKYGIGCYIFDVRGHGNSQGPRGDTPSTEQVLMDVADAIKFVKKENKNSKLYLVGHSSGASLIINYAAHTKHRMEDGYIFLAPYLGAKADIAKKSTAPYESFIKKVRIAVYILGALFPRSFVTHWKTLFFNYSAKLLASDPLIVPFYTYAMASASAPYDSVSLLQKIDKPVGVFIGAQDEQFVPEKVIAYADLISAPVKTKIVENAAHLSILLKAPQLIANYVNQELPE
jgi:acylglycerol lipase